jgi:hypothetical protein
MFLFLFFWLWLLPWGVNIFKKGVYSIPGNVRNTRRDELYVFAHFLPHVDGLHVHLSNVIKLNTGI